MPAIFVCSQIPDEGLVKLRANNFEVDVNKDKEELTRGQLKDIFKKYDGIITLVTNQIDSEIIDSAGVKMKIISNYGVGFDNIDVDAARKRGIIVTNTPGVASESVAEHTFMLILACAKQVVEADKFVRLGKFKRWDPYAFVSPQVWGKTIGIIGLGRIGTFVANIAYEGFKMRVLYYDVESSNDFEMLYEAKYCELNELLSESDFITIHCPLNDNTRHLVGKNEFKLMKKSAILVNTGRGAIVDEEALIRALSGNKIAGAGLDVFEHEPDISEQLRMMPNVILTPHSASATLETRVAMSRIAAQNIIDVFNGKEPFGLVKN